MRNPLVHNTTRWRRLRNVLLAREPRCRRCGAPAQVIDHIKSMSAGGAPWDTANMQPLCFRCHNSKTRRVDQCGLDQASVKGCDVNGMPLDPGHWWRGGKG